MDDVYIGQILINSPGGVRSSEQHLQCEINVYTDASVRLSKIDGETSVLDVRMPIVTLSHINPEDYVVVEGHTRFCEAFTRKVGIEAWLVRTVKDLDECPAECFKSLPLKYVVDHFRVLSKEEYGARLAGVSCISDLVGRFPRQ